MKRGVAILGVLVLLWSCGTTGGPAAGTDWGTLESFTAFTGPMEFLPEVEAANLRISLFFIGSSVLERAPDVASLRFSRMEPFGVYLGNGLAIDSAGSVFLDVLKLLRIDTSRDFRVTCKADDSSGTIRLTKDDKGTTLDSPRGRGTVVQSDGELTLKTASGKESMKLTTTAGAFSYRSTIAFDPSSEMKADGSRIAVKSGLRVDSGLAIDRQEASVVFNPSSGKTWPSYIVTKQGDAYIIEYRSETARLIFKVYFSESAVYVVRNGFVMSTVKISDSSVLVNGKEVVTYSRG